MASAAPILALSDDLIMLLMKTEAKVSGTLDVLRGFASARRRFQELAYGESSTLFEEPVFNPDRPGAHPDAVRGDTILDVARLSARFGDRIQRLSLGNVSFDFKVLYSNSESAAANAAADRALWNVLRHCPNLTHLSLAGDKCRNCTDVLIAMQDLPPGFSLPRLRHLDLSGLAVPLEHSTLLSPLLRLLRACSGTLERLFLR
eukprot:tig00020801_g13892.t1